jgi:hypothetical protein
MAAVKRADDDPLLAFCTALAWTFPATLLLFGLALLTDPGYATYVDGARHPIDSNWQARGLGMLFAVFGAAVLVGFYYLVRPARRR